MRRELKLVHKVISNFTGGGELMFFSGNVHTTLKIFWSSEQIIGKNILVNMLLKY